jgi:hypothetical protein
MKHVGLLKNLNWFFRAFVFVLSFAAHNALFLVGASPAAGIGCLPA